MRRPTALAVDTAVPLADDIHESKDVYELTQSPSASISTFNKHHDDIEAGAGFSDSTLDVPVLTSGVQPPPPYSAPNPSIALLFSFLSRHDLFLLIFPAIFTSVLAGGIAPFMTRVIGDQFDVFASYPLHGATEADKDALRHGVGLAALQLVGLAVGALVLSSLTSCLWISAGERNTLAVRKHVFAAVAGKDMIWFDTRMGAEGSVQSADGSDGPLGAGGMMAKFARETDEVREASSLAAGWLIQYLTTFITALALAFARSWQLTFVILSAVPALMVIQTISQIFAGPRLAAERAETATAGTLVDRAVAAIATVKAFNAQAHESAQLNACLTRMRAAADGCARVWALTQALSQFATFAMFVQGFWFGARLVRSGKCSAGDVMAVFWACLIATSNLQMCIPQFVTLAKGKFAIAALVATAEEPAPEALTTTAAAASVASLGGKRRRANTMLRKIRPARCDGEISLQGVSFSYPSRPGAMVLEDVSLYLPAGDMTFVVGGSGSGKSTIAQLLLRMYEPTQGQITLDEQDVRFLDESWVRQHVAAVSQNTILFDRSVHDNVALGLAGPGSTRRPEDATREEVERACRAALMHEFVRDLPEGYDTLLGTHGASLSGGQKQRLAIARAILRNPTVLILDEATSALDATSRILVFEAIKHWRQNMSTIVITHDLSQLGPDDFVYVLKSGRVAEQGFRADLEKDPFSTFREMADSQGALGGFPVQDNRSLRGEDVGEILDDEDDEDAHHETKARPTTLLRPLTLGNWMFDVVADLSKPTSATAPSAGVLAARAANRMSRFVPMDAFARDLATPTPGGKFATSPARRRSVDLSTLVSASSPVSPARSLGSRRLSLQFTPTSPVAADGAFTFPPTPRQRLLSELPPRPSAPAPVEVKVEDTAGADAPATSDAAQQIGFWRLMREIAPTVPGKPLIVLGVVLCLCSGAMTPLFSFLLSRVMYEVSIGARAVDTINLYGGLVLAIAAADGAFMGLKYLILESAAMRWVTELRERCFALVLRQDKRWFDSAENSPVRMVQILVKDGDDARSLIATVLGQLVLVASMLLVGLVWALVWGWQLTLVGFAIAPVFAVVMAVQTRLISQCELQNKRAKEEVAKGYYETILNIRGIRSMGFENVFTAEFNKSADIAHRTGVRGSYFEGCSYGVASALIYLSEALLFYVGAVLVANGTYTYLRMVETLNLVVFTVTIGSQLMSFTERIAKSTQATADFNRLLKLSVNTDESRGTAKPSIEGTVRFENVSFAYPSRPDVQVLDHLSLELRPNECVAVVGASGSGKSTVASLLQRLYEPASGRITIGGHELQHTDVAHLREHVSVVSQTPNLFDASVAANIAYGTTGLDASDIQRAAMDAHAHEFVSALPNGYDTSVGENAALISGGQAQRIQIARALARPARILVLDECTSALDAANQAAVMATVRRVKVGRTTLMVTHKLPVMQMCDRIIVVDAGRVAESGTYDELVARKGGVFARLARGGEWDI